MILLILFLISTNATNSRAEFQVRSRGNYGVVFRPLYEINNMGGNWKILWKLDTNEHLLKPGISQMRCLNRPDCVRLNKMFSKYYELTSMIRKDINTMEEWMKNEHMYSVMPSSQFRHKRGLFDFIGQAQKALFGIATSDDLKSVTTGIAALKELETTNVNEMHRIGTTLTSFMKTTTDQFSSIRPVLNEFHRNIITIGNKLEEIVNVEQLQSKSIKDVKLQCTNYTLEIGDLIMRSLIVLATDTSTINHYNLLIASLATANSGILSPTLIDPTSLTRGLEIAEEGIRSAFPRARLRYPKFELGFYYSSKITTVNKINGDIFLILDVPMDFDTQYIYLFHVFTFPVHLNLKWKGESDDELKVPGAYQLTTVNDVFGITIDGSMHTEMSLGSLENCKGEGIKTCQHQLPLQKSGHTCLESIWFDGDPERVLNICHWEWRPDYIIDEIFIVPLDRGSWYFSNLGSSHDDWTLSCSDRNPVAFTPVTQAIIKIDCSCSLSGPSFVLPSRIRACDGIIMPVTISYPVSPFMRFKTNKPDLVINGSSMTRIDLQKHIEPLTISDSEFDRYKIKDKELTIDMKKLITKNRKSTEKYENKTRGLLDRLPSYIPFNRFISGSSSVALAALILSGINSIVVGCLCFCMRARAEGDVDEEYKIEHLVEFLIALILIVLCFQIIQVGPVIGYYLSKLYRKVFKRTVFLSNTINKGKGPRTLIMSGTVEISDQGDIIKSGIPVSIGIIRVNYDTIILQQLGFYNLTFEGMGINEKATVNPPVKLHDLGEGTRSADMFFLNMISLKRFLKLRDGIKITRIIEGRLSFN